MSGRSGGWAWQAIGASGCCSDFSSRLHPVWHKPLSVNGYTSTPVDLDSGELMVLIHGITGRPENLLRRTKSSCIPDWSPYNRLHVATQQTKRPSSPLVPVCANPIPNFAKEIAMPVNTEKFADAAKSNLDSVLTIAGTALSCVERLAALNLNTSRNVLASAVDSSKALLGVKNAEELAAYQIDVARPALENVISYSRAAYAICVETAEELNKIVDAQLNVLKAETVAAIDVALKSAPAGSEPAVAMFKSTLAATDSAYDAFAKAAKQVGEMAESSLTVATDNAVKALTNVTALPKGKKKAA
ncbi:MAG: phasin family protein [Thermomicrobiales bacterium]|nr:MAG: phasin family protein [Thermomicrobiales bacterium]